MLKLQLLSRMSLVVPLSLALWSCEGHNLSPQALEAQISSGVVYGKDDRQDAREVKDAKLKANLAATAAVFTSSNLVFQNGALHMKGRRLGEKKELCSDQPFFKRWSASRCTAVLIGPKLILTAGHCMQDNQGYTRCDDTSFVFGWRGQDTSVPKSAAYGCRRVIEIENTPGIYDLDYALVELDRPVREVKPVTLGFDDFKAGDAIYTFGHPNGLSAIYATGKITDSSPHLNVANAEIDGFDGNSGGGLFTSDHRLRGIYASGETDYIRNSKRGCFEVQVCKPGFCVGETILQLGRIRSQIERALAE